MKLLALIQNLKSQPLGIFLLVIFILSIISNNSELSNLIGELKALLSTLLIESGESLLRAGQSIRP